MLNISKERTETPKAKPDWSALGFGNYFTDHMFIMDYGDGRWHSPRIVPYAPIPLDPAAMVLHYGQEAFEGMKAYRTSDGRNLLFRPYENIRRLNASNERLCMPQIDEEDMLQAIRETVRFDIDWMPVLPETSLYIRPFIIASDPFLGVRAASSYMFIIILSPVGAYYPEGLSPTSMYVETEDVRAVRGGTGRAKCGGNYAATIRAQKRAKKAGYTQVLWLDGIERKYVEEVGTSNIFFKISGEIVTPPLTDGSILPGVTRSSCLEILRSWGMNAAERRISIDEVADAAKSGALEEAFGSGTAAVVSPIGALCVGDKVIEIGGGKIGDITMKLYKTLTGIQWGELEDTFGWTVEV